MSIKQVKITMLKYGMASSDDPVRRLLYMPVAEVTHCGNRKGKTKESIDGLVDTRRYHNALVVGQSFFAVMVKGIYRIFDEDCKLQGEISAKNLGKPIEAGEDYFVCRKDDEVSFVSEKGVVFDSRPLTDAEKETLEAKDNKRTV